jgi:K(+)-stimulated pyrophosphate-energized sodium pump
LTELGLIVGIDAAALAFAALLWRLVSLHDSGPLGMRRLGAALERAARALLFREYGLVAVATALTALAVVALRGGLSGYPSAVTGLEAGFWTVSGLLLGALFTTFAARAAAIVTLRGSVRAAAGAQMSLDRSLTIAMRSAGTASLLGETLSLLGFVGLFGAAYAIKGGFALPPEQARPLAAQVVGLLPCFALGAAAAALVVQRAGGTFHAASGVASDGAGERDAGLDHDDPRNPAVVSELIGDHVGAVATRSVDAFLASSVGNSAALLLSLKLAEGREGPDATGLLVLPILIRAFGILATAFSIPFVRTDEASNLAHALLRGHVSTAVISLAGIAGICYWLVPAHWGVLTGAGALGVGATSATAYLLTLQARRSSPLLRDASDAARLGAGALLASGMASSLLAIAPGLAVFAASGFGAVRIAQAIPEAGSADLTCLVWGMAALSVMPYTLALASIGPIADGARGIAAMTPLDQELKRRIARLDDAAFISAAVARQYAALAGALVAFFTVRALSELTTFQGEQLGPVVFWGAALGATLALGYAGASARAAVRCARELAAEVERQLRGFPREHGIAAIPSDYTPSYKTCVDLGSSLCLRQTLPPVLGLLLLPGALGLCLRALFHGQAGQAALVWLVLVTAVLGLTSASYFDVLRTLLGALRRTNRTRDSAVAFTPSIVADALGDVFGNSAAPALQLTVKALAATALVVAPLLL